MNVLKPFSNDESQPVGKIAIGTVKRDLHDIGKNLVKMMQDGAGFEVNNLGVDVVPKLFISAVNDHHVDIVAMPALITTSMPGMSSVIELLEKKSLRQKVKVLAVDAPIIGLDNSYSAFRHAIGNIRVKRRY